MTERRSRLQRAAGLRHFLGLARHVLGLARHFLGLARHFLGLARHVLGLARHVLRLAHARLPPRFQARRKQMCLQCRSIPQAHAAVPFPPSPLAVQQGWCVKTKPRALLRRCSAAARADWRIDLETERPRGRRARGRRGAKTKGLEGPTRRGAFRRPGYRGGPGAGRRPEYRGGPGACRRPEHRGGGGAGR